MREPLHSKFMKAASLLALLVLPLAGQSLEERIAAIAKQIEPTLIECRRDLHMHPELSNQEVRTGKFVAERLKALGLDEVRPNVAGNGVVALLKGGKPGPVVAWRADMDALPIDESNFNVPYKSTVKGVKHACGHDAHTAIGLGIAETLMKVKADLPGTVKFLFQPAEEGVPGVAAYGARLMIQEGALENPKPKAIFAFHVNSQLSAGEIGYTDEAASSFSGTVTITFKGKRSHGAYPYQGIDAVAVASQCILALQTIHSRRVDATKPSVLSLGTIHGGERRNVIAETVKVVGTLRTFSDAVADEYEAKIRQTLDGCTQGMGAGYEFELKRGNSPMVNVPALNRFGQPVLESVLGTGKVKALPPGLYGEDFSAYQKVVPGTMFFLGIANAAKGITAPVHTAEFDIDERALAIGVRSGASLLVNYLMKGDQ